ncbi:MAG TPA: hypothetical protein VGI39_18770 [Polyangiaceae bacterium]
MRTSSTVLGSLALLLPALAGCSAAPSDSSKEAIGTVNVAIEKVPTDVTCIEIDVVGLNTITQRFPVKAGASSVLNVTGLPLGSIDISGQAWNGTCQNIGAPATWAAQSVSTLIQAGKPASANLTFFPVTNAQVGVDFESETYRNVTTLAGGLRQTGSVDGVGAAARFNRPQFLANDGANLYVADGVNETIRKIVIANGAVTTLAGNPSAVGNGVDGVGSAATFNHPEGIAFDSGNLYIADSSDGTIRKLVLGTNAVTTLAGQAGVSGSTDGAGADALFNEPFGVTADGAGHLFVADVGNANIRQIDLATGAVTTIAGSALQTGNVDGIGAAARFLSPGGIATDGSELYVTDGSTVRMVDIASGHVYTILGDPATPGTADGFAPRFNTPEGIAFDASGQNLFITDPIDSNVRQYSFNTGIVTTVAGTAGVFGFADGLGPAAEFSITIGVTVDPRGTVYVSDTSNQLIRKM